MHKKTFNFKSFIEITKLRLSLSVVFSSIISYIIGIDTFDWNKFICLILGGILMVSASNIFNQVIEKDLDALMSRTQNRPLPTGGLSVNQAILACVILSFLGLFIFVVTCRIMNFTNFFLIMHRNYNPSSDFSLLDRSFWSVY